MINYQYLLKHSQLFPALIGITKPQFDDLLKKFEREECRLWYQKAYSFHRLRGVGGGRKAILQTAEEKLLFILFYYKHYPTFQLMQIVFEFDVSNTYGWVRFLEQALWKSLGYQLHLPKKKIKVLNTLLEVCPDLQECIIDATERRIQRPKYNQEFYYSGKKKYHTIKNQVVTDPRTKKILHVSKTVEGKRHDKKLLEDTGVILRAPPKSKILTDLGYQGSDTINPLIQIIHPYKKPHKADLTDVQKQTNTQISSIRVRGEHPFAYIKHFRILSNTFRSNQKYSNLPFHTLAALYNFTRPPS